MKNKTNKKVEFVEFDWSATDMWYDKPNSTLLDPDLLSEEDLLSIHEFLSDYDRTEMIEEFIVSKFSKRGVNF